MKRVKYMPVYEEIEQDEIIEALLFEIQNSFDRRLKVPYHPDKIYVNKKTMTLIVKILGNIIESYLKDDRIVLNHKNIIKPFPWLRLYAYEEPDKKTVNNLTGKEYTRKGRRRFKAYIPVYHQRQWNGLD